MTIHCLCHCVLWISATPLANGKMLSFFKHSHGCIPTVMMVVMMLLRSQKACPVGIATFQSPTFAPCFHTQSSSVSTWSRDNKSRKNRPQRSTPMSVDTIARPSTGENGVTVLDVHTTSLLLNQRLPGYIHKLHFHWTPYGNDKRLALPWPSLEFGLKRNKIPVRGLRLKSASNHREAPLSWW